MGRSASGGAGLGDRIEFLPPRESLFGGDTPAEFSGLDVDDPPPTPDDAPRLRWLTAAAALSVLALISVGVVAAAPWRSHDSAVAPPPTTVPPPETTVVSPLVTATSRPAGPISGFVFDPLPTGFAVRSASSDDAGRAPAGWGEVWATPDATRNSGSWFSVTLLTYPLTDAATDATRVDLGDGVVGLLEQLDDGTMRLTGSVGSSDLDQHLTIISFGLAPGDLESRFRSVVVADPDQATDDRVNFRDSSLLAGFELVHSGATFGDLVEAYLGGSAGSAIGHTSTTYSNGADDRFISVDSALRDDSLEPIGRLAVGPLRIFPDTTSVPGSFTGEHLVLGVSPSGSDPAIVARWHVGDTTLVVRTNIPLGDLLTLLPTLRRSTAEEWRVVRQRSDGQQLPHILADTTNQGAQIGTGTLADGATWTASWESPEWIAVRTPAGVLLHQMSGRDAEPISVSSSTSAITITAVTASGPVPASLRVLIHHQVLTEVPLVDVGTLDPTSSFSGRVAAVVIQHIGPFEVEVIDADETVIAQFLSPGSPG